MGNKILVLLLLFILASACKKDKPTPPEPDFTGCKITGLRTTFNGAPSSGVSYFYKGGCLYSINNTDASGTINTKLYNSYKYSGNKLAEKGRVESGNYIPEEQFEYDNWGRLSAIKTMMGVSASSAVVYRFYYNSAGNCTHILVGSYTVTNNVSVAKSMDSVVYDSFTVTGNPRVLKKFKRLVNGSTVYDGGYRFEYDALGNCIQVFTISAASSFKEVLSLEYEYELSHPLNDEYLEMREIMHMENFSPGNSYFPPFKKFLDRYPVSKRTIYYPSGPDITDYKNRFR